MRIEVRDRYAGPEGMKLQQALEHHSESAWLRLGYTDGPPKDGWMPQAPDAPFYPNGPFITLEGDGKGPEDRGLRYWRDPVTYAPQSAKDSTLIRIGPKANHLALKDLVFSNNAPSEVTGTGCGILYDSPSTVSRLTLDRVAILSPGRNCLRLQPGPRGYVLHATLNDCDLHGAPSDGMYAERANCLTVSASTSRSHKGWGMVLKDSDACILQMTIEDVVGGLWMKGCAGCQVTCRFETWAGGEKKMPALVLEDCIGCTVHSTVFSGSFKHGETSILLKGETTGCVILPSLHGGVGLSVDDGGTRGNVIYRQPTNFGGVVPWRVNANRNRVI